MSDQIILAVIGAGEVVLLAAIRQVHNKVKACGDLSCRTAINAAVKKGNYILDTTERIRHTDEQPGQAIR